MSRLDKEAKKLYEKVNQAYKKNPNLGYTQILNDHLSEYSDAIADELKGLIFDMTNATLGTATLEVVPLTPTKKSPDIVISAISLINKYLEQKSTVQEIEEALCDRYEYNELLEIMNSYETVDDANYDKEFEKELPVELEEKARYYAYVIANTLEGRAFTLSNAKRQIDSGIKFVKWTLSSHHNVSCICDLYANQDVGYGKGIYPLLSAPAPVYSTHRNCRCSLRDYYRTPIFKEVKDLSRKKHPIVTIGDLFN